MKDIPLKYRVMAVISVLIMTSYGLAALVSGAAPHAVLNPLDYDMDGDGIIDDGDLDDDNDGMPDNYEIAHGVENGGWQNPYVFNARYGLIAGSGGDLPKDSDVDGNFPAHWNDAYGLYNKLVNDYRYLPENVYLLYSKWIVSYPVRYSLGPYVFLDSVEIRTDGGEWENFPQHIIKVGHTIDIKITWHIVEGMPLTDTHHFDGDGSLFDIIEAKYSTFTNAFTYVDLSIYRFDYEDCSTNPSVIDGEATRAGLENSLKEIGNKITKNDFMFMGILAHGSNNEDFSLRKDLSEVENEIMNGNYDIGEEFDGVKYSQTDSAFKPGLKEYLSTYIGERYAVMTIVNQACYSGSMITYLAGKNRILITSADSTHESWTETTWWPQKPYEHFAFMYQGRAWPWETHDGFILNMGAIGNPKPIEYAYEKGEYATYHNHSDYSYPQIESGDVDAATIYL